jgi:branched-chain amino acid transport system ATP-binding protein
MLEIKQLNTYYDQIQILKDINVFIKSGMMVSVIGSNGAGKSTLIRSISGLVDQKRGTITFEGVEISHLPPEKIVKLGICQVPEGRHILGPMTVSENLELGYYVHYYGEARKMKLSQMEFIYSLFPVLKERKKQQAGSLSGGEQQMLAIGRALMGKPRLLLLDEPSIGLAPLIVKEVFRVIKHMQTEGINILLVEQNAKVALKSSDYAYTLENGKIVYEGIALELLRDERIAQAYLGEG